MPTTETEACIIYDYLANEFPNVIKLEKEMIERDNYYGKVMKDLGYTENEMFHALFVFDSAFDPIRSVSRFGTEFDCSELSEDVVELIRELDVLVKRKVEVMKILQRKRKRGIHNFGFKLINMIEAIGKTNTKEEACKEFIEANTI